MHVHIVSNITFKDSFNRYMVECECYRYCYIYIPIFVLIDTWWNVNSVIVVFSFHFYYCFNRYMVECE